MNELFTLFLCLTYIIINVHIASIKILLSSDEAAKIYIDVFLLFNFLRPLSLTYYWSQPAVFLYSYYNAREMRKRIGGRVVQNLR